MKNIYNNLIALSDFFDKKKLYLYANRVDQIIKNAGPKQDLRDLLLEKFDSENINKVYGISDAIFKKINIVNPEISNEELIELVSNKSEEAQNTLDLVRIINDPVFLDSISLQIEKEVDGKYSALSEEDKDILIKSDIPKNLHDWVINIYQNEENDSIKEIISVTKTYLSKQLASKNSDTMKTIEKDITEFSLLRDAIKYLESILGKEDKEVYVSKLEGHALSTNNTDIIFEDEDYHVVLPKTKDSAIWWSEIQTGVQVGLVEINILIILQLELFLFFIMTKLSSKKYDKSSDCKAICLGHIFDDNGNIKSLEGEQGAYVNRSKSRYNRRFCKKMSWRKILSYKKFNI